MEDSDTPPHGQPGDGHARQHRPEAVASFRRRSRAHRNISVAAFARARDILNPAPSLAAVQLAHAIVEELGGNSRRAPAERNSAGIIATRARELGVDARELGVAFSLVSYSLELAEDESELLELLELAELTGATLDLEAGR